MAAIRLLADMNVALAEREDRALVSHDLDFSALLAVQGRTRPSLITLRLRSFDPQEIASRLVAVLPGVAAVLARGAAATVEDSHVRIRLLPIE